MAAEPLTETQAAWQSLLHCSIGEAYDKLAELLQLPKPAEFPRPGDARAWMAGEWLKWGADRGFVAGAKTKRGQFIQHQRFPSVCAAPLSSPGDQRGSMNCAMEARRTLMEFLERARAICGILAQDKEVPQSPLGEWIASKVTGTIGQQLAERTKQSTMSETEAQSIEASGLLSRLKGFYQSSRQAMVVAGLTESTADKVILLNKNREDYWTFMGLAGQLIPALRLLLSDHMRGDGPEVPEPEVLGPDSQVTPNVVEYTAEDAAQQFSVDAEDDASPQQLEGAEGLVSLATRAMNGLLLHVNHQRTIVEAVAQKLPEFVQVMRQRNNMYYKMVNEQISFQAKQHSILIEAEKSDLLAAVTGIHERLDIMTETAEGLRKLVIHQSAMLISTANKLHRTEAQNIQQADQITKLEEQLTDPLVVHQAQKIKDVRALFQENMGFLEAAKSIERAKQMLDALIKANAG